MIGQTAKNARRSEGKHTSRCAHNARGLAHNPGFVSALQSACLNFLHRTAASVCGGGRQTIRSSGRYNGARANVGRLGGDQDDKQEQKRSKNQYLSKHQAVPLVLLTLIPFSGKIRLCGCGRNSSGL